MSLMTTLRLMSIIFCQCGYPAKYVTLHCTKASVDIDNNIKLLFLTFVCWLGGGILSKCWVMVGWLMGTFVSFFTFLRMNICMCDKTFMTSSFNLAVLEIKKVWNIFQTKINRKKSFSDKWPKTSTHHLFIRSCFHKSQICFTKFAACFDLPKTDFCLRNKIFKKVIK